MNPWLEIPLDEYEAHMSMASVAQAQYLAEVLERSVRECRPRSVAVIGSSGGNGFDKLPPAVVRRVVGVDINPDYIATTRARYAARFRSLELVCEDVTSPRCVFDPVDLVFAGLILEYVDPVAALSSIVKFMNPGGYLSVVLQLPHSSLSAVSPTPFHSLETLNGFMHFVSPVTVENHATSLGFSVSHTRQTVLDSGKAFQESLFHYPREYGRRVL